MNHFYEVDLKSSLYACMPVPDQTSPQLPPAVPGCLLRCRQSFVCPTPQNVGRTETDGAGRDQAPASHSLGPTTITQYIHTFSVFKIGLKALNNFNCFDGYMLNLGIRNYILVRIGFLENSRQREMEIFLIVSSI